MEGVFYLGFLLGMAWGFTITIVPFVVRYWINKKQGAAPCPYPIPGDDGTKDCVRKEGEN